MAICPNCGNQTGANAVFCDQCGARLPAPAPAPLAGGEGSGSLICPACGAGHVPGEAFCDYCGAPLEAPAPQPEAIPAPAEPAPEPVAPVAPAEAEPTCPSCGAKVLPGEAFCADCGASLAQAPIPPEPAPEVEVPAVPAPVPAVEEGPPAPPLAPACPACGAEVEPADRFCSNCGAALAPAAAPPVAPAAPPSAPPVAAPPGPRLVVVASGAEFPLPSKEEILIGRTDPVSGIFPEIDLTDHGGEEGGVSRRHARIVVEGGAYFIEDLNSTNGTIINKQRLAYGSRQALQDGDEIRCGRVALLWRMAG